MISILSGDRDERKLVSFRMTEGGGERFPEMGKNLASDGTGAGTRLPAWQSPLLAGSQAPCPLFRPHGQNSLTLPLRSPAAPRAAGARWCCLGRLTRPIRRADMESASTNRRRGRRTPRCAALTRVPWQSVGADSISARTRRGSAGAACPDPRAVAIRRGRFHIRPHSAAVP